MRFLALLIGSLFFAGFIFCILIYPIWLLVHCAISPDRSKKSKAIWIVFMILVWPIAGLLYGLFGSKRKAFQWFSGIIFALAIATLGVIYSFTDTMGKMPIMAKQWATQIITKMDQMDTSGLSSSDLTQLKADLSVLSDEITISFSKAKMVKVSNALRLIQLFDIFTKDNKITMDEYSDWLAKFKSREMIDMKAFEKYIDELKTK